jgi:hypothetical protein
MQVRPLAAGAPPVRNRYPYRLPEWLWQDAEHFPLLSSDRQKETLGLLAKLDASEDEAESEKLAKELSGALGQSFAVRDISIGAVEIAEPRSELRLAAHIDPEFTPGARSVIETGLRLLLRVALDPAVIQQAIDDSTTAPQPEPTDSEKYEMENGTPKLDVFGNKVLTDFYSLYLTWRVRPADVATLQQTLRGALAAMNGDPAGFVISRYSGNAWWGGGFYDFVYKPDQQLERLAPARGYVYIRLNSDQFADDRPGHDDPAFWASKIAHEMLHTLGYLHPNYKNPEERDSYNQKPGEMAFIVAYERAVLRAARALKVSASSPARSGSASGRAAD